MPSIFVKALVKTFSLQLWPLLASLARAIIEASGFYSGFNSDVRQFNSPVEPVHFDIIVIFRLSIRPYTKSFPVVTTIILRIGKIVSSSTRIKIRILYVLENINLKN